MNSKNKSLLLFLSFFLSISAFGQEKSKRIETINGKKFYLHTITAGQTLFGIAKIYELDKNDIIIENPDVINGISVGKVLKIPYLITEKKKQKDAAKTNTGELFHIVEQGQTAYSISKLYGLKTAELFEANPEAKNSIRIGQRLTIPAKKLEQANSNHPISTIPVEVKEEKKEINIETATDLASNSPEPSNLNNEVPNIALLLPLFLNNNDSIINNFSVEKKEIYSKTLIGLEFYEGFMMAADSVSKLGMSAKFFTYDVENDSLLADIVLHKSEMKKMNLIIGPFYSSSALSASDFSKKNKIMFVSPFAPSNKILLSNPFAYKVVSSPQSNAEAENDIIFKTKSSENIIALYSENNKDKNVFSHFAALYRNKGYPDSLKSCSTKAGYKALENLLSPVKENVLVIFVSDQAQVTDIINHIRDWSAEKKFSVFGMENWASFDNLEFETMESLQLHYPSSYYVNYDDENTQFFIKNFREKYATEPSKFAFEGYDVGMCFLSGIQKYGKDFYKNFSSSQYYGLQTNMRFVSSGFDSGYENKAVHLLKIEGLKLKKIN